MYQCDAKSVLAGFGKYYGKRLGREVLEFIQVQKERSPRPFWNICSAEGSLLDCCDEERTQEVTFDDYEPPIAAPNASGQTLGKPGSPASFVTHILDSRAETKIGGNFWIPAGAKELRGMAIKLSRTGQPGSMEIRFGSRLGSDDIGTAKLDSSDVDFDRVAWREVQITPHPLRAGTLVYYDITCASSKTRDGHFVIYGPRPIGGEDWPSSFALSYKVITDRPQDAFSRDL
jgi:hypothetical protein